MNIHLRIVDAEGFIACNGGGAEIDAFDKEIDPHQQEKDESFILE